MPEFDELHFNLVGPCLMPDFIVHSLPQCYKCNV